MAISINPDVPSLPSQPSKAAGDRPKARSADETSSAKASPDSVNVSPLAQQRTGAPVGDGPPDAAIGDAPGRDSGIADPDAAAERASLTSALIVGQPETAARAHANLSSHSVLKLLAA